MFGTTKVKIDKQVWEKVKKVAAIAGYSSPDEFVGHAIEKLLDSFDDADSNEDIRNKLKGLGYIS